MSFSVAYRPLFSVAVQEHGSEVPLTAFSFSTTESCEGRLADRGLVFRRRRSGFQVFYSLNQTSIEPLLGAIDDRTSFAFLMHLVEPDFFERYEPDLTAETGPQLYFDNLTPSGNIQGKKTLTVSTTVRTSDAARLHTHEFIASADLSGPGAPTRFRVKDKFDAAATVHEVRIAASAGAKRALTRISLRDEPPGVYTLETDAAGSTPRTIYVDNEVARSGAAGITEIHWETPQDGAPAGGVAYFIRFRRN